MRKDKLYLDIETFSSIDIKAGVHKYVESPDFDIILLAYSLNKEGVVALPNPYDSTSPEAARFFRLLNDPEIIKVAHNAQFEMAAFKAKGERIEVSEWGCSMVSAAYAGLPLPLGEISKVLDLGENGKLDTGTALINYFCKPCKPTKANNFQTRNIFDPENEKFSMFVDYCVRDVEAMIALCDILENEGLPLPSSEIEYWALDQKINGLGVLVDLPFALKAIELSTYFNEQLITEMKALTGLANPNSTAQLLSYLHSKNVDCNSLTKDKVKEMLDKDLPNEVVKVLKGRQLLSKSSVKKYGAMVEGVNSDNRARGLFQFYGANRTGRFAGRRIQLQNLPQNHLSDLDTVREAVLAYTPADFDCLYADTPKILSELIRTAFVAPKGKMLAVADFSAIEARVIAWLTGEDWRNEVFRTHGKIYEASAAAMFNVPIESVTKGSDLRQKGKIAELALGYQGGVNALMRMGGDKMGLSESEMESIVNRWRKANPSICEFWNKIQAGAKKVILLKTPIKINGLVLRMQNEHFTIELPSKRGLVYRNARVVQGNQIEYQEVNSETKKWGRSKTYGGKLTENIVQAIARDLLIESMHRLDKAGFTIVMHVHDEVVCEVDKSDADKELTKMCQIMSENPIWATDLVNIAMGYTTPYYKKD